MSRIGFAALVNIIRASFQIVGGFRVAIFNRVYFNLNLPDILASQCLESLVENLDSNTQAACLRLEDLEPRTLRLSLSVFFRP